MEAEGAKDQSVYAQSPETAQEAESTAEDVAPAVNSILGPNLFIGFDLGDLATSITDFLGGLFHARSKALERLPKFSKELLNILIGRSEIEPEPSDKRFNDPAWKENPFFRALMQGYLAWRSTMLELVNEQAANGSDWKTPAQKRFAISLLTEALSPTNVLFTNPAALKRAFDTGGWSLLKGLQNFVDDLLHNGGMPSQVDKRPFKVGENIGVTPGAVVYRNELCELLQYRPSTREVYERPLLLVPPQINKFYIMDLAPRRSLTEYAVGRGIPFFTVSWRNPKPVHRDWGLDQYVSALKEALAAVCEIGDSETANLLGVCSGGITSALLLGHLAALGDPRINAATLVVTMLDSSMPSMTGMFTTAEGVAAAIERSRREGVLNGADMARLFAWLRPNDLVWNYWVNNYLMGRDPAPFDILYWNADSTNLPAELHAGFLDLLLRNPLVTPNSIEILGTPIDLSAVDSDLYVLAGLTDHICSWRSCYHAAQLLGGRVEFVLNGSGHVQSLVSPTGHFKSRYFTNPRLAPTADKWREAALEHKGSWWEHWAEWLDHRSGDWREAPRKPGNETYRPLMPAPGAYVHQRP